MKNLCFKIISSLAILLLSFSQGFAQPTATVTPTATTCGLNNGSATVNPTGGTGTYTYHWYPSGLTTTTILNQPCGAGIVRVFDGVDSIFVNYSIGCSTAPGPVSIAVTKDTFCLASADTLTASSAGAVSYSWSGGTLSGTSSANPLYVTAVTAGSYTYTVTATDGASCTATASKTLVTYDVSTTVAQIVQPSCGRNTGSIQVTIQPRNSFRIDFYKNGLLIQSSTSLLVANNLLPGTYSYTYTDLATGCSGSNSNIILVDNSVTPTFDNVAITPESCFGMHDGAIVVTVGNCSGSGCVYSWTYDATNHTDSAKALTAGTYYFSVNGNGCSNVADTIIVPGPSAKLVDTLRVVSDHCNRHIGTAIVLSHGGTPPYSYAWSQGTQSVSAPDSVYSLYGDSNITVIVMDSHGCVDTLSDSIGNTPGPSARITNTDTICVTESNGVLMVQATSNDGPFTYSWSSGSHTTVAGGLRVGGYGVTVTNAVGCDTVLRASVQGYAPAVTLTASPSAIYEGQTVSLAITTGVPTKNIDWTPFIPGSTDMPEAYDKPKESTRYSVVVTYGENCKIYSDTVNVTVNLDTSKMVVPNTFTPNGDGINDNFSIISYPPSLKSFHIWVFDRWGGKVYESTDVNFYWDGTDVYAANKPLNTAVFAYAIEYTVTEDPEKRVLGGNISLVK